MGANLDGGGGRVASVVPGDLELREVRRDRVVEGEVR